ncbi:hypothetical protein DFP73DRAFT_539642 [Morchella snyderi]|nr:hypothetical protein DFP73DRAFT_539642 [Morchella snyderi]
MQCRYISYISTMFLWILSELKQAPSHALHPISYLAALLAAMQRSTTSHPISKIPVGKEEIKEAVGEGSRNGGQTDQSNLILSLAVPMRLQPMLVVSLSPGCLSLVVAGHPTITCLTYRTSHITPATAHFACLPASTTAATYICAVFLTRKTRQRPFSRLVLVC